MSNKSDITIGKNVLEVHKKVGDYIILERIGLGAYATVYKAYRTKDKQEFFAIKCFERSKLLQTEAMDNIITEIKMLKMFKHPNVVHMSEFLWDDKYVYIVEEYCDGGDLSKYIKKRQKIPEKVLQIFLKQIALGLLYLRSFNICHLDLKPSNLLLVTKPEMMIRIGDFGLSQFLSNETYQGALRGSPLYMAPEMLLKRQFDAKVDLWSVGIIAYECLFGKAPFASCSFKELRAKLQAQTPIEIPEDSGLSKPCQELLRRLLKYNPEERIDYEEFFSHPFVDVAHQPSPKTYSYAVELLHQAVKHDSNKEYQTAFNLYCDALAYLVPHIHAEKDPVRKEALRSRLSEYMKRTEAIRDATKLQKDPSSSSHDLGKICASTPALLSAIEIAKLGDLFLADGLYEIAMEKYRIGIEMLIDLIPKEPAGTRKDLLLQQTNEWVAQASRAKTLHEMTELQKLTSEAVDVKDTCTLQ